ncbi:MAG: hypothetical protein ACJ8J0_01955, partial [Longimicrobiaceae bacterium]
HFHFGDDFEEEGAGEAEAKESSVKPPLHKLHFPLWPFLTDPDENPHEVFPKLLQWSHDELRRIDVKPKGRV